MYITLYFFLNRGFVKIAHFPNTDSTKRPYIFKVALVSVFSWHSVSTLLKHVDRSYRRDRLTMAQQIFIVDHWELWARPAGLLFGSGRTGASLQQDWGTGKKQLRPRSLFTGCIWGHPCGEWHLLLALVLLSETGPVSPVPGHFWLCVPFKSPSPPPPVHIRICPHICLRKQFPRGICPHPGTTA